MLVSSLVNYFAIGKVAQCNREGLELLKPFIAARRDEKETKTDSFVRRILPVLRVDSPSFKQNDFLSWLIKESKGIDAEDWAIVARMIGVNFAAIHTSSMVSLSNHHINLDSIVV